MRDLESGERCQEKHCRDVIEAEPVNLNGTDFRTPQYNHYSITSIGAMVKLKSSEWTMS